MSLVLTGTSGASNLDSTNGLQFATWTTATRPASPIAGQMGYNTTTNAFDAYVNGAWVSVATSATAPTSAPTFSATSNANQTITGGTFTLVSLQTKNWDTNTSFNNTGSTVTLNGISVPAYAFAPVVAGYYQVNFSCDGGSSTSPIRVIPNLYKNGSQYKIGNNVVVSTAYGGIGTGMVYLNGTTDYIQMYAYIQAATAIVGNVAQQTYFEAFLARTA